MASVFDVAQYILQQLNPISGIKLQKLVYYCQAWYLAWNNGEPLFSEPIEAWINGPVVRALYNEHRGQNMIFSLSKGNSNQLKSKQKDDIQKVLDNYGNKADSWLILRSHEEKPWQEARKGLQPMQASNNTISIASMLQFYKNKDIESCVR